MRWLFALGRAPPTQLRWPISVGKAMAWLSGWLSGTDAVTWLALVDSQLKQYKQVNMHVHVATKWLLL